MVKRNFTRIESVFDSIAQQYRKEMLLREADEADAKRFGKNSKNVTNVTKLLHEIYKDLIILSHRDKDAYESIEITEEQIHQFIMDPAKISPDDWQVIRKAKRRLQEVMSKYKHMRKKLSNSELVTKKRKQYVNLNVKDGWMPL